MKDFIKLFISFFASMGIMATIHILIESISNEKPNAFFLGYITCYFFLYTFGFLRGEK